MCTSLASSLIGAPSSRSWVSACSQTMASTWGSASSTDSCSGVNGRTGGCDGSSTASLSSRQSSSISRTTERLAASALPESACVVMRRELERTTKRCYTVEGSVNAYGFGDPHDDLIVSYDDLVDAMRADRTDAKRVARWRFDVAVRDGCGSVLRHDGLKFDGIDARCCCPLFDRIKPTDLCFIRYPRRGDCGLMTSLPLK